MKPAGRWTFQAFASRGKQPRGIVVDVKSDKTDEITDEVHIPPHEPVPLVKLDLREIERVVDDANASMTPATAARVLESVRTKVALIRRTQMRSGSIPGISDWKTLATEEYTLAICEHKAWLLGSRMSTRPPHPGGFSAWMLRKRKEAMDRLMK